MDFINAGYIIGSVYYHAFEDIPVFGICRLYHIFQHNGNLHAISNRMDLVMPLTSLDQFTTSCNGNISCCLSVRIFEIFRCLSDELFESVIGRITSSGLLL